MESTNIPQELISRTEQLMSSKAEIIKNEDKPNEGNLSNVSDPSKQTGTTATEKPKKPFYSNYAKDRGIKPKSGPIPEAKISSLRVFSPKKEEILVCRFDHESNFLALSFTNGHTGIYAVGSGHLTSYVNCCMQAGSPVTAMRWRPPLPGITTKTILVTGSTDGTICHWHVTSSKLLHRTIEQNNQILAIDYNNEGSLFATAGKDFNIRIYDETTKVVNMTLEKAQWRRAGHSNRIFSLKFLDDQPDLLLSGGWDTNLHIWDLREGKSVACIYGPEISGDAIDYKEGMILTGSCRRKDQIELWDFGTRKLIRTVDWEYGTQNETLNIYAAQFSKQTSQYILACSSVTNEARIFDRKSDCMDFAKVSGFSSGLYTVDFAPNQEMFAVAGGDGEAHIFKLNQPGL